MENLSQKITVQIVLYEERFGLIKKCLENLKGLRIIIIDNKNNLRLKKKIIDEFKIDRYILNKKNAGYSKAHNQAASYVNSKYLLILNADCLIGKKSIETLIETIEQNDRCGLVSPTTFDNNNNLSYNSGCFPEKGIKDKPLLIEGDTCVETVLGSSMLISKKLFQELEGFDENFFLYFSDDELCKRINKRNLSVIQSFKSRAIHTHGISKVQNMIKKIFLREFHYTYDELYYYHKQKIDNYKIKKNINKKQLYFVKFFLNLIFFKIQKSAYYLGKFLAIHNFKKLKF